MEVVTFKNLRSKDDLFVPGTQAAEAFVLMEGAFDYIQECGSSPVDVDTTVEVIAGQWLCEAALWCEWRHVGRVEAVTACQVLAVHAGELLRILKPDAPLSIG